MKKLRLTNVGQIRNADIEFGDLTVFVGPQATGKSIALQMVKLLVDSGPTRRRLKQYGVDWEGQLPAFLDAYLGEGMHGIWRQDSTVAADGNVVDLAALVRKPGKQKEEGSLFFIPAQRVLTMRDGWPRPFSDYGPGDPFSVRNFSDEMRMLMEGELGKDAALFPRPNRLKQEIRELIDAAVFHGFGLHTDKVHSQRRLVLGNADVENKLPFMVWSAGQREFVPLLLGLYWLLPAAKTPTRKGIEWVVIEELEMGLHPKAITAVMLLVLDLLWRGYKVCLSTHSSQVLDILWALRILQENGGQAADVLDLFGCRTTPSMEKVAQAALHKRGRVFLFQQDGQTTDISRLDPGAENSAEAGWGGLSEFSGHVGDIVSRVVTRHEQGVGR